MAPSNRGIAWSGDEKLFYFVIRKKQGKVDDSYPRPCHQARDIPKHTEGVRKEGFSRIFIHIYMLKRIGWRDCLQVGRNGISTLHEKVEGLKLYTRPIKNDHTEWSFLIGRGERT